MIDEVDQPADPPAELSPAEATARPCSRSDSPKAKNGTASTAAAAHAMIRRNRRGRDGPPAAWVAAGRAIAQARPRSMNAGTPRPAHSQNQSTELWTSQ